MSATETTDTRGAPATAQRRRHWSLWVLLTIVIGYLLFPAPAWNKIALIGFALDPQRPSHSIYFGEQYMPVEARKTGMYGGFLLGLIVFALRGRGRAAHYPGTPYTLLILALASTLVFDGFNAVFYDLYLPHLYPPNLYLRLGTGLLTGLALAALIGPAFNQTVWRTPQPVASIPNLRALVEVLLVYAVYFALAFTNWPPLLIPIALFPGIGLFVLLMMMAITFTVPMRRREKTAHTLTDLAPDALIALIGIVLFFAPMVALRFLLFQGWGPLPAFR